jgi:O-acetyl-ADP-ribose deacetylase (regulator of RNase III)
MPQGIWLVHPDTEACDAFRDRFDGLPGVHVVRARLEDLEPHDCFVTAGNAFGIMTAGIDAAVVGRLGVGVMRAVQSTIVDEFLGEQPVGTAFVLRTGDASIPHLCHAPTMRVPGSIERSDKVYSATWAALVAMHRFNGAAAPAVPIRTAAFPAFGTGFGGVTYDEAARQMAVAYRHFLHPPRKLDWDVVIARHKAITYDGGKQVVTK